MSPLNPALFRLLKRCFGQVRVSNSGVAQTAVPRYDPLRDRQMRALVEPGEYYCVSCPFCGDTRFRLWINHRWGQRDELGGRNLWQAVCYNEKCLQTHPERREYLFDMVTAMPGEIEEAIIKPGKQVDRSNVVVDWPGPCTRLDKLPEGHEAREYVRSRGFDPDRIGRFYGVSYCRDSRYWLARGRIIIPIFQKDVLKGWQARFIGEVNWKAPNAPLKYWSCPGMPRRALVYNLDHAREYQTGVIVEGPTDVWAVGPMAVCTLGANMSREQRTAFVSAFRRQSVVLLYDEDRKHDRYVAQLAQFLEDALPGRFVRVNLPPGTDPGSLDREFLRGYVTKEAGKAGMRVSWRKR